MTESLHLRCRQVFDISAISCNVYQSNVQHPPTSSICTSDVHSTTPPVRKTQNNLTAQYTNSVLCTLISKPFRSPEIQITLNHSPIQPSCTIHINQQVLLYSFACDFSFISPNVLDVFQVKRNAPFRSYECSFQFNFFFVTSG